MTVESIAPSFWQRARATWIDTVLLIGAYIALGYLSETLFDRDAYPPAKGMQFYSEYDFEIFKFFVVATIILTSTYLFVSYTFTGGTLGQKITGLQLVQANGEALSLKSTLLRIFSVLLKLFLVMIPGPLIAFLFFAIGANILNPALSMALLVLALLGLLRRSILRYEDGHTTSMTDAISGTTLVLRRSPAANSKH